MFFHLLIRLLLALTIYYQQLIFSAQFALVVCCSICTEHYEYLEYEEAKKLKQNLD